MDNLGDVKTVSGEALPVLGMLTTPLDIAKGSYSCTFLVVQDLPYDALLGRDFLRENGAIINLEESALQLGAGSDVPERELGKGLTCHQSPVQKNRHEEFTEERSATRENLLNKEPSRNMPYTQLSWERYSSDQPLMKQMCQEKVIAVSSRFPQPATVERRMFLIY